MKKYLIAAMLLLAVTVPAAAWLPHGTVSAPVACPFGTDNGCAAAPTGGQFINPNFFTTARQSGQPQYKNAAGVGSDHPPDTNLPGVDYAVGSTIADASLLDAKTNTPPGCGSFNGSTLYFVCSGSTINGYLFNGAGIYGNGGALFTITNSHFIVTADNCKGYFNGLGLIYDHAGTTTTDWVVNNNTFTLTSGCSQAANLYKLSNDPGLVTQASINMSITSNVLTVNSGTSGEMRPGQFLNYSTQGSQVVALGNPISGVTNKVCVGAGCNGTTWDVCNYLNTPGAPTCPATVNDAAAVNATTGPVLTDIAYAVGAGKSLSAKYNAVIGWGDFAGLGGAGGVDVSYNYGDIWARTGQHQNFVQSQPQPGSASTIPFYNLNGNALVYSQYTAFQSGTGMLSEFTVAPSVANSGGYEITTTKFQAKNNVVIANTTTNAATGATTGGLLRYLSQGTAPGNATFTLSGGVATVVLNSGSALAVGQFLPCVPANGCTHAVPITSFGTGTGGNGTYNTSNTTDTITSTTGATRWYPGEIGTVEWIDNWFDPTGSIGGNGIYSTDSNVPVTTTIITGNRTLITGAACNSNAACP